MITARGGKNMSSDAVVIRSPQDVVALVNAGVGKGPSFWVLLIALGGILTDAYDLISFGIGVPQVASEFHLSPGEVATISASLSFGAIFGAWFGGYFIDKTLLILSIVPLIMLVSVLIINWDPVGRDIDAEDFSPERLA
jgi:hypothetical protein